MFTPTRKIQIIIFHLSALLAAWFLPEHAPVLLFNVSITTGEGSCILLQLYLVNILEFFNSHFFSRGSRTVPSMVLLGAGNREILSLD